MELGSLGGDQLELMITGYQFPDAPEASRRYAWHMVRGCATTPAETWEFHWPALTCDESEGLPAWLLRAAELARLARPDRPAGPSAAASFTEPDLLLELERVEGPDEVRLRVDLDLELRAPSNRRLRGAGAPSTLHLATSARQLRAAAAAWSEDVAQFPDRYPYTDQR